METIQPITSTEELKSALSISPNDLAKLIARWRMKRGKHHKARQERAKARVSTRKNKRK